MLSHILAKICSKLHKKKLNILNMIISSVSQVYIYMCRIYMYSVYSMPFAVCLSEHLYTILISLPYKYQAQMGSVTFICTCQ